MGSKDTECVSNKGPVFGQPVNAPLIKPGPVTVALWAATKELLLHVRRRQLTVAVFNKDIGSVSVHVVTAPRPINPRLQIPLTD